MTESPLQCLPIRDQIALISIKWTRVSTAGTQVTRLEPTGGALRRPVPGDIGARQS
jgi:hypothetical protein